MALGTITPIAIDPHSQQGGIPVAVGDLKMTVTNVVPSAGADYPTGGVPITPAQLNLSAVFAAQAEIAASTGTNATATACSVLVSNNGGTVNLKMFSNANAEIANGTNLSGVTFQIIAFGY